MYNLENNPILTVQQITILRTFFDLDFGKKFFLTGGTALAGFYLAHRLSEDLDFFTVEPFDTLVLEKVIQQLANVMQAKIITKVKTIDYYEVYLENTTAGWTQRLDFVKEQPVVFGERILVENIIVDSIENITTNKILTIYGRLEPKDYLDLYYIFKTYQFNFDELFEKTKQKDTGLHEFYFANIIADVSNLKRFPNTTQPFQQQDLVQFYQNLSQYLLQRVKPNTDFRTEFSRQ